MKSFVVFVVTLCLFALLGIPTPSAASDAPEATDDVKKVTKKKLPNQGTTADRTRLVNSLFSTYDKRVNPDKVKLQLGLTLLDFKVHEEENLLETHAWFKYQWNDDRLRWNPEEFGGVDLIRFPSSQIWNHDVTLYNSKDPVNMVQCWETNALIYPEGKVLLVPPCKMFSKCQFTLKDHPYDEQTCTLKFGSWTLDGTIFDLEFYNGTSTIDTSVLAGTDTSGFNVLSTSGERNVKYYDCCAEPYLDVTYNMTIQRKQE